MKAHAKLTVLLATISFSQIAFSQTAPASARPLHPIHHPCRREGFSIEDKSTSLESSARKANSGVPID